MLWDTIGQLRVLTSAKKVNMPRDGFLGKNKKKGREGMNFQGLITFAVTIGTVFVGIVMYVAYTRFRTDAGNEDIKVIKGEVHETRQELTKIKEMIEGKVSWDEAKITFVSIEKHDGLRDLINEKFNNLEHMVKLYFERTKNEK